MLAPDDPRHGTLNGYGNCACRCADCREAGRLENLRAKAARLADVTRPIPHGTYNGYINYGCRCNDCIEASRLAGARRRADLRPERPAHCQHCGEALVATATIQTRPRLYCDNRCVKAAHVARKRVAA